MRVCIVLCAILAYAAAGAVRHQQPLTQDADAEFLQREKAILQLLSHIYQPIMMDPKTSLMAKTLKPAEFYQSEFEDVSETHEKLIHFLSVEPLEKGEIFEPMNNRHFKHAKALYELLRWAKNFEIFNKTALWAREHLNEGVFMFALTSVLREREDTHTITLPPLYEVMPNMFIHSETMQKAYEARMRFVPKSEKEIIVIPSNFTMKYHHKMRPEMRLAYFTEDPALNEWNYDMIIGWPKFMDPKQGEEKQFYSEMLYFGQRQLLAKYRLERLANNVEDLKKFMMDDEKMVGYVPNLRYKNGREMSMRPEMEIRETQDMMKTKVIMLEERFKRIIDEVEKHMEELTPKKRWTALVSLINAEHTTSWPHYVVPKHLDSIVNKMMLLAHHTVDPTMSLDMTPGALLNFETQLRDPLYYSILLRINDLYLRYKSYPYERSVLAFPDMKIETLEFEKLMTYFENFDTELNNALDVASMEEDKKMSIVARGSRINHKPFSYQAIITSQKATPAAVRLFIGPKYDVNGIEMSLTEKAPMMMEMDRFVVDLTAGKNKIERSSKDFPLFREDKDNFRTLNKKVEDAIMNKAPFPIYQDDLLIPRMPAHLLLPKGKKAGMAYSAFMIVSPLKENDTTKKNQIIIDHMPLGYPFDYQMDPSAWVDPASADHSLHPNMIEKEIYIYHKKTDEMHEPL